MKKFVVLLAISFVLVATCLFLLVFENQFTNTSPIVTAQMEMRCTGLHWDEQAQSPIRTCWEAPIVTPTLPAKSFAQSLEEWWKTILQGG